MTQSSEHAKLLYPEMPLCIGYLSEASSMTFATSLDSDYTSLGYLQEKYPDIIDSFKNGEWYVDHGKTMSIGEVCYIKSNNSESLLEIPLTEMHLFVDACGQQKKKCKVCNVSGSLKKCNGCDAKGIFIFYCSEKCQKKDWKKGHKNHCFSTAIENNEEEKKQEEIEKCKTCGANTSTLKKCSGCQSVLYCNRECQKRDWKNHRHECIH